MRHRHLSNSFPRFGIDQQDNNHTPVEHSYFPTGRGVAVPPENSPFIGQMNHHISRSGEVTHRLNLEGGSSSSRANEYHHPPPPSNINMEIVQPLTPPFSHQPITDNRSLPPGGHVHPHYTNYNNVPNANPAHDMEAGSSPLNHHPTGKRKRSSSFNSLYTASTSSSSQMPMELEKQTPPPFRGSLTIDGQDSSRNVRRRYRHDDMESESTNHIPNHFYQPTTSHPPPNYPSTPPVPHYPAPSPHIRLPPPDISGARHEMGQFHGGDSVFSRPSSQNLHGHHHHHHHGNNHTRSRIQSSYGNGSRYSSHYAHGGTSSTNAPESFSSRNSRHCSPGGWRGSYRSGRPRIAVERFHSVVDVTESHNRIGHDTLMMVDRASFYGNSRNFSDQYRDLRLDIDNMSYEELLNLEERIGSVNTGLSEDSMSKFLKEKVYYSSDQHHEEEVSCPICLEEYKNGDNIGKMEKCGHGYHVDCIKKWLMMKKLCPICKTECSNQEPRVEG